MTRTRAAVLTLLAMAAPALAAVGAELEDSLPESTVALLRLPGWTKSRKALDATALGRIAAEEGVKPCLAEARKVIDDLLAEVEKGYGVKRAEFERAFGGELALAFCGLAKTRLGDDEWAAEQVAGVFAVLAEVTDAAAAERAAPALAALLTGGTEGEDVKLGGAAARKFTLRPELPVDLYSFRAGGRQAWVFSPDDSEPAKLAAALVAEKREKPLAADPAFKLCRREVGSGGELFLYVGVKAWMGGLAGIVGEPGRKALDAFSKAAGCSDLTGLAWSVTAEPPGFRTKTFAACAPEPRGIPGLLGTEALPADFLKLVPGGATMVSAGSLRPGKVLPMIREMMTAFDEKRGAREFDRFLEQFKQHLGFDLEKDLIASLGRRYCLYVLPPAAAQGNPMMSQVNGAVLLWEVSGPEGVKKLGAAGAELMKAINAELARFQDDGKGPITSFDYRGHKVYSIDCEGVATPGYAVTDKYVVVGGNVAAVKRALARLAAGENAAAAVTADEKWKAAAARVKTGGACAVSYHQPSGDLGTVLGLAAMVGPEMRRELLRGAGRREPELDSMARLAVVNEACRLWAEENGGDYPPDLGKLDAGYLEKPAALRCPEYRRHARGGVDYGYLSGLRKDEKADHPVAFESVAAEDGTVNVLFLDGRVQNLKLTDLREKLAASKKALAAAGRKSEIIEPQGVKRGPALPKVDFQRAGLELLAALVAPEQLPAADAIGKHLFPSIRVTRRVEGGLLSEGFCPLGISTGQDPAWWGLATAPIYAALFPVYVTAFESASSVYSKSNLRQIGLACHMYADDNDEVFPKKDLNALTPDYVDNKKIFQCRHYRQHSKNGIDYAYIAGMQSTDPGSRVLAYEVQPGPRRKVNVLFCDAHVESMTVPRLKATVARQVRQLRAKGRKIKVYEPEGIRMIFKIADVAPEKKKPDGK
ncbi:MAG: hypothetical protein ACYTGB_01450 [Planctomycetota bacterium]|jgi:prepilin-type processing-associated H-X9-DG protein